jgi:hypothetical protein
MTFDVDHMSARSKSDTLDICEAANYPVVSGHTGFVEISHGDKRHEGQLLPAEIEQIRQLGGMVAIIVHQGTLEQIATWQSPGQTVVQHTCGNSSNTVVQAYLYAVSKMQGSRVAFGTDFNGLAGLPGPRHGNEACHGGSAGTPGPQLSYPFTAAATGRQMSRSVVGQKTFDFNFDGLAHVGMLPDLIADFQAMGLSQADLEPLLNSAEGYVSLWEKAWRRTGRSDHLYTTSSQERDTAVGSYNYISQGVACYVHAQPTGSVALYRLFNQGTGDHFYTTPLSESDDAIARYGYRSEGIACYVHAQPTGRVPLYRLRYKTTDNHFYTTSLDERLNAIFRDQNQVSEGIACYVHGSQAPGTVPLYRLYKQSENDHFYTTSAQERDEAVARRGYRYEFIACYVYGSQVSGTVPLYRLFQRHTPLPQK